MFAKPKYIADDALMAQYAALPKPPIEWLFRRREEAVKSYRGYPTTHVESWKFTNVKPLLDLQTKAMRPNQGDIRNALTLLDALPLGYRAVFVNGIFNTSLSNLPDIAGVEIKPLRDMLRENPGHLEAYLGRLSAKDTAHSFALASLALAQDGLALRMEENTALDQPLIVGHIHTGGEQATYTHARNVYILKPGAQATIIEMSMGVPDAAYVANSTTEIFVGGAAKLVHGLIQRESEAGARIDSRYVYQDKRSRFEGVALTTGAQVNRIETQITLGGIEAHSAQQTVQLLRDKRHGDSTTVVTHNTTDATSHQHCRMILDGTAKGAFQGKTIVARDAQKTDAHQLNKNLLLSRGALVNSKPELEIYADDVKCSHGATTGELDDKALFYLESRGIERATARQLLVEAFADEVIEDIPMDEAVKSLLRGYVAEWMGSGV